MKNASLTCTSMASFQPRFKPFLVPISIRQSGLTWQHIWCQAGYHPLCLVSCCLWYLVQDHHLNPLWCHLHLLPHLCHLHFLQGNSEGLLKEEKKNNSNIVLIFKKGSHLQNLHFARKWKIYNFSLAVGALHWAHHYVSAWWFLQ